MVESLTLEVFKKCGTVGHGLVGKIGGRRMVGLDDLRGLFHSWCLYDSMSYGLIALPRGKKFPQELLPTSGADVRTP